MDPEKIDKQVHNSQGLRTTACTYKNALLKWKIDKIYSKTLENFKFATRGVYRFLVMLISEKKIIFSIFWILIISFFLFVEFLKIK